MTGDLVQELGQRVTSDLSTALAGAQDCALIDFPRHLNVGDCAIWAGERAALDALGIHVSATADKFALSLRKLRRLSGDGPLLIHGGGNFGDLYLSHHALREEIIQRFPDRRIIQLPQSINFQDEAALERTRTIIGRHGGVTLMVRDRASYDFAQANFDATVLFTADAAFAMGALDRPREPVEDVVVQVRTDKELASGPRPEGVTFDWLDRPTDPAQQRTLKALERRLLATAGGRGRAVPLVPAAATLSSYDAFAAWNVDRGCRMLAGGRSVITDRLHGHILCVLMDIPHVVVNDRFGKISDFWEAWTHAAPRARLAATAEEAAGLLPHVAERR